MGFAVELYFDNKTEKSVRDLRQTLFEEGISPTLSGLGDRPHISLAVFSNVDPDGLTALTKAYADQIEPFNFQLSAVGTFPTDENVLFLTPAPTRQLLLCHQNFHDQLAESKFSSSPYYMPANWVPHCTVEMNIPAEQLPKAVDVCKKAFKPLRGQFQEIGVIEFRPVKHLATWSIVK